MINDNIAVEAAITANLGVPAYFASAADYGAGSDVSTILNYNTGPDGGAVGYVGIVCNLCGWINPFGRRFQFRRKYIQGLYQGGIDIIDY